MNFHPEGYKVLCDTCKQRYYAYEVRLQWDGIQACPNCFDTRHPITQPIPAVNDDLTARKARPRHIIFESLPPGLSRWGVSYRGKQGLDPNLTWGAWSSTWADDNDINDLTSI